jgi:hypothetical protein
MDGPEVLVSHYASLAFYTRLAALTFVGAIVGALYEHLEKAEVRYIVGVGILLVVVALAEFNRRYTDAYIAAVYAASVVNICSNEAERAAAARWQSFRKFNRLTESTVRSRMLLSWLTCLPGFMLGEYLLFTCHALASRVVGVSLGIGVFAWLAYVAWGPNSPAP